MHFLKFKPLAKGTKVWWRYRSAIGHGEIEGVHKMGTTNNTTEYDVKEFDHHPDEPDIVPHFGKALHKE